jgi:hypothetical protein
MNYKRHYDLLIQKRKVNIPEGYSEKHHIVPKCMGGTDEPDNLVRLTAREHYIAHMLLYKQYKTSKLAHAWFSMMRTSGNQERVFTSRQYENAKQAHISALKETQKGSDNSFYGKTHTSETRKTISEKNKQWNKTIGKSEEQIRNWVEKVAKKPASDKQKQTLSRLSKNKVMLKNIHTGEVKKVYKSELSEYNSDVWKNPAAISQRRDTCVHCGKESVAGNIKRWHNENCKMRK